MIGINSAIPFGLILNEMISNAHKHAFSTNRENRMTISIDEDESNQVTVEVKDNGPGVDERKIAESDSLGFLLIETFTKQLKGTLKRWTDNGLVTKITYRNC